MTKRSISTERVYGRLPEIYTAADALNEETLKNYLASVLDQYDAVQKFIARFEYLPESERRISADEYTDMPDYRYGLLDDDGNPVDENGNPYERTYNESTNPRMARRGPEAVLLPTVVQFPTLTSAGHFGIPTFTVTDGDLVDHVSSNVAAPTMDISSPHLNTRAYQITYTPSITTAIPDFRIPLTWDGGGVPEDGIPVVGGTQIALGLWLRHTNIRGEASIDVTFYGADAPVTVAGIICGYGLLWNKVATVVEVPEGATHAKAELVFGDVPKNFFAANSTAGLQYSAPSFETYPFGTPAPHVRTNMYRAALGDEITPNFTGSGWTVMTSAYNRHCLGRLIPTSGNNLFSTRPEDMLPTTTTQTRVTFNYANVPERSGYTVSGEDGTVYASGDFESQAQWFTLDILVDAPIGTRLVVNFYIFGAATVALDAIRISPSDELPAPPSATPYRAADLFRYGGGATQIQPLVLPYQSGQQHDLIYPSLDDPGPLDIPWHRYSWSGLGGGISFYGNLFAEVVPGETYTFSFYARSIRSMQMNIAIGHVKSQTTNGIFDGLGIYPPSPVYVLGNEWTRYSRTFVANGDGFVGFSMQASDGYSGGRIDFVAPTLDAGPVAKPLSSRNPDTPWRFDPDDEQFAYIPSEGYSTYWVDGTSGIEWTPARDTTYGVVFPGDVGRIEFAGPYVIVRARRSGQWVQYEGVRTTASEDGEFLVVRGSGELIVGPGTWDRLSDGNPTGWFDGDVPADEYGVYGWTTPGEADSTSYWAPTGVPLGSLGVLPARPANLPLGSTSDLVNPVTADDAWLPWIQQFFPVQGSYSNMSELRGALIAASEDYNRGSIPSIVAAVRQLLDGSRSVRIYKRANLAGFGGSATMWDILIVTAPGEYKGTSMHNDLTRMGAKPAGVVIHHRTYSADWDTIQAAYPTWNSIEGKSWRTIEMTGL